MAGEKTEANADIGVVTIGGENTAVYTDAEHRGIKVCAPGGFFWRPRAGEEVLVIKSDAGENCAVGVCGAVPPVSLMEGEVYIKTSSTAIHLKNSGGISITGNVNVEGVLRVNGVIVE